ncbi:MAG: protein-L-isoaspartate(D-aspartate) O-methyltransferase [Gammaproteobacteria bacterium]|nr:protein-L-isoaspartate(D-aspartate) O-methyltransferase [Gammaproteobacteria bacterium]MDH5652864.1 protein-L-isoaspartate(D-aspartate) O-methyltransferase [Gammaproteobacteria bacterium]
MSIGRQGIGMTSQRTRDRLIERLRTEGIQDERILAVIRATPRHLFMDEALSSRAYEDTALPIGHGQTISQPYIVARMTEALFLEYTPKRILEIGTGSGYQTAILAQLCREVFSIERIDGLLQQARERLRQLELTNVLFQHGDGYLGWPEHAPYDGIMVTAAPVDIPARLLEQLNDGGKLVLPKGAAGNQQLLVITRQGEEFKEQLLDYVSFVPLLEGKI